MVRKKILEFDGATFTIAPLKLGQLENFLNRQKAALEKNDRAAMEDIWREFICTSLNNALDKDSTEKWKPETLKDELDLISFQRIRDAALEFSGIKLDPGSEKKNLDAPEIASAAAS